MYVQLLTRNLNTLDQIFFRAKNQCEFEFILTLLRVRGLSDAGWDGLETLAKAQEAFYEVSNKLSRNNFACIQNALFVYGLICEASEPYELIANMFNVIEGGRFHAGTNFINPKKKRVYPPEKIRILKDRASSNSSNLELFDDFFDRKLRNAIFHSDYSIHGNQVRLLEHPPTNYSLELWQSRVNGALAYFDAFMLVYRQHLLAYKGGELVKPHPSFTDNPKELHVVIARDQYGLTGLKSVNSPIPCLIGRFSKKESQYIDRGAFTLPKNRIEQINKILVKLPAVISKRIVKLIQRGQKD